MNIGWSQLFEEQTADPEPVDDRSTKPWETKNPPAEGFGFMGMESGFVSKGFQGTARTNHESSPLKNGLVTETTDLRPVAVISKLGPVSKSCHHD